MARSIRLNPYGNQPGNKITRNAARAVFVGTTPTRLRMVRTMRDGEDGGDASFADSLPDIGDLTDIISGDIDPTDIIGGGSPPPVLTSNVDELIDIRQQIDAENNTGGSEDVNPIFGGGGKAQTGAGQLAGGGGEFGGETFQQTGAVESNKGESWFGGASGKAGPIAVGIGGGALVGGGIGALVGGKRKRLMGAGIGALVGVLLGGGGAYLAVGDK